MQALVVCTGKVTLKMDFSVRSHHRNVRRSIFFQHIQGTYVRNRHCLAWTFPDSIQANRPYVREFRCVEKELVVSRYHLYRVRNAVPGTVRREYRFLRVNSRWVASLQHCCCCCSWSWIYHDFPALVGRCSCRILVFVSASASASATNLTIYGRDEK